MRARSPFFLYLGACVVGGMIGAVANSAAVWAAGQYGLAAKANVAIHPDWTWEFLKPRILWGGIWGAGFTLFALPLRHRLGLAALIYSLLPSAFQLFYVFPVLQNKGQMGTALGQLTPAFVLVANAIYALVMALWVRISVAEK